ncbi:MAG: UDP-N-acetylmuramate--alanine ligase [Leptospiraceae bacterium]|nr:UDP-N-acetylmuramate--alanine ligase [Leptospiraceae bacterium]
MRIHLTGVGGVAMGNLAAMLKASGHDVSGSDQALYPPMSDRLREWGIKAREFDASNLKGVELCIIGNVISRGNVEAEAVLNQGLPYLSMSAALAEFFLKDKEVIVVAGTHGKTTTTFLMDHILTSADNPPGLFAGGLRADGMDGFRISDSRYFVIEGDEYDTAFFDKGPKFLHYKPRYLIVTSLEYDHADIYPDLAHYRQAFERLLRLVPSAGLVAACYGDVGVRKLLKKYDLAPVHWYASKSIRGPLDEPSAGSKKERSKPKGLKAQQGSLKVFRRRGRQVQFSGYGATIDEFALIGDHNTANASACLLVAERLGLPEAVVAQALHTFPGVMRRQQIRSRIQTSGTAADSPEGRSWMAETWRKPAANIQSDPKTTEREIIFMEDFAHHPTAVEQTIQAVRKAWPRHRLHVLYEPRSATSHRSIFQTEYIKAFHKAHSVYLCDIYNKNKVSRRMQLDVRRLVREIQAERKKKNRSSIFFAKDPEALLQCLANTFMPHAAGDIILAMSNGSFGGIYPRLESWLASLSTT